MPDISMCANNKCSKKKDCYRYRALPDSPWQAYSEFEPLASGQCDYFEPLIDGDLLDDHHVPKKPKGKKY